MENTIKIYFQTVSPESAKNSDYESMGEHDFIQVETIEEALNVIENYGYLEPSSSNFHQNIWYTTIDPERCYKTGNETYYTIHFDNFSENDQLELYNVITGKK